MLISLTETLRAFIERVARRRPLDVGHKHETWTRNPLDERVELYRNRRLELGIDFCVERLGFAALETLDPRVVRIAPGCNNELHKHAHESLFVILEGEGEVFIGDRHSLVRRGDVAFVPRWTMHQTRNSSLEHPLVVLAITDFGLTSTILGNYDRRTRLRHVGKDAFFSS